LVFLAGYSLDALEIAETGISGIQIPALISPVVEG
jgi:hypothetical protein